MDSSKGPEGVLDPVYLSAAVDPVFKAYQHRLRETTNHRQDLADFRRDQTFFQVMCYLLCEGTITTDASIAELTCNEAVKHSSQFHSTFRCAPGTPMHPSGQCRFFH
ncbi:uncharacterized protein LOC144111245 [Amblyomma americanum]